MENKVESQIKNVIKVAEMLITIAHIVLRKPF